jgi:hypothetical protein
MNITKIDLSTASNWNNSPNWATDEEWVRAAANLEAETGVDILIGADLGNNLHFPDRITKIGVTQARGAYTQVLDINLKTSA